MQSNDAKQSEADGHTNLSAYAYVGLSHALARRAWAWAWPSSKQAPLGMQIEDLHVPRIYIRFVRTTRSHHQRIVLASKFAVVRMTSETIARHWRHLTTERSCTFYTLDKAIYGHTLSDRVETIMFNLIRGTGNIKSLLWKRKFSTFFYNRFFLSFQHLSHNTHFNSLKI